MKHFAFMLLAVAAMAYTTVGTSRLGLRVAKPLARRSSSGHTMSSNILKLKKSGKAAKSSSYLKSLRTALASNHRRHDYGAIIVDNLLSAEYITEIAWNGNPVNVIVDTGSSDTWLVQDGFTCVDQNNRTQPVGVSLLTTWTTLLTTGSSSKPTACLVRLSRAHSTAEPF